MRRRMWTCLAATTALVGWATARADLIVDDLIGFGTIENCSYGVSIDGDYAAVVDDEGASPLYYYHFPTRTLTDVGLSEGVHVRGASISDGRIAYLHSTSWGAQSLSIYDIDTGATTDTGVTTAKIWWSYLPMRFFDGDRVMFVDGADGHIKYYSVSGEAVTDTGIEGSDPTVDGDRFCFTRRNADNVREVVLHDLSTDTTTVVGNGSGAVLAGGVIAYMDSTNGGVSYYRLDSEETYNLEFDDPYVVATDGRRIAVGPDFGSIKIYDIAEGTWTDTGSWPCVAGMPCWLEIEGEIVAHERYEADIYATIDGTRTLIYAEQDINGDGEVTSDCPAAWFVSELPGGPADDVQEVIAAVADLGADTTSTASLAAPLQSALGTLEDANERNDVAAENALNAFLNQLAALRGNQVDADDADALRAAVLAILDTL